MGGMPCGGPDSVPAIAPNNWLAGWQAGRDGYHKKTMNGAEQSLESRFVYQPRELRFGTSGRRGEVADLTQLEIYLNVSAEIAYLQSIPRSEGGIARGDEFYIAHDLRPSSISYVPGEQGRGEIFQAVVRAAVDRGMRPVNCGAIPTPALAHYALSRECASIMVTGSHIPFDRNGYKLNTARGELRKQQEGPIGEWVGRERRCLYEEAFAQSLFDERGMFKAGSSGLPAERADARAAYLRRYADFFEGASFQGKRIAVYQHSAVGRDLLVEILESFGAEVVPVGRSETFVPIDTENLEAAQLATIQDLTREAMRAAGPVSAVVSTDGDSDRPLVLGVDDQGSVRFFGGDLLGMIVAGFLGADAVVVPISCNDGIDRGALRPVLEPKTKIGSPYVIEGLEMARSKGRRAACGWEANGGFLTGSDIERNGKMLSRLATRDAFLPILCVLFAAEEERCPLADLFARLPARYSRAALLKRFPQSVSREIIERFSPGIAELQEAVFVPESRFVDAEGRELDAPAAVRARLQQIRGELQGLFGPKAGFPEIARLNYVDGVRMIFANGDVAHVRPSGNADELRIYAVSDTQERADAITQMGVAEPDGILRSMESLIRSGAKSSAG